MSVIRNPLFVSVLLGTLVGACGSGMNGHRDNADRAAGQREVQSGVDLARQGIQAFQAGDAAGGLDAIARGRSMMGQGMEMMGLGCCLADGGIVDDAGADRCASMMGPGAPVMVEGLGKFDGGRSMLNDGNPERAAHGMADMEMGMTMMEEGSAEMMKGGGMAGGGMM